MSSRATLKHGKGETRAVRYKDESASCWSDIKRSNPWVNTQTTLFRYGLGQFGFHSSPFSGV